MMSGRPFGGNAASPTARYGGTRRGKDAPPASATRSEPRHNPLKGLRRDFGNFSEYRLKYKEKRSVLQTVAFVHFTLLAGRDALLRVGDRHSQQLGQFRSVRFRALLRGQRREAPQTGRSNPARGYSVVFQRLIDLDFCSQLMQQ
jgi:hypothetical protein